MAASQVSGQREQQQQQPANKISENAETARCLTPFSHPEQGSLWFECFLAKYIEDSKAQRIKSENRITNAFSSDELSEVDLQNHFKFADWVRSKNNIPVWSTEF